MAISNTAFSQTTTIEFSNILSFQHRTNLLEITGLETIDFEDEFGNVEPATNLEIIGFPIEPTTLSLFSQSSNHHQECVDLLVKAMESPKSFVFTIEANLRDDPNNFSSQDDIRSCGLISNKGVRSDDRVPVRPGDELE